MSAALYMPLWAGLDHAGPLLLAGMFSQSPLGLLRELWTPSLGEEAATESAARLGAALLVVIVAIAMYRRRAVSGWRLKWYSCIRVGSSIRGAREPAAERRRHQI